MENALKALVPVGFNWLDKPEVPPLRNDDPDEEIEPKPLPPGAKLANVEPVPPVDDVGLKLEKVLGTLLTRLPNVGGALLVVG